MGGEAPHTIYSSFGKLVLRAGSEEHSPAGWDPIYGKSPIHFAGNVHAKALEKAIKSPLKK